MEVYATGWHHLEFTPFFPFVQLCMRDSNYIVACTAEDEVKERDVSYYLLIHCVILLKAHGGCITTKQ